MDPSATATVTVDKIMEHVGTVSIHLDANCCDSKGLTIDQHLLHITRVLDFVVCTLADHYDSKGITVDQCLLRVTGVLDPVLACFDRPPSPHSVIATKNHHRVAPWHRRHHTTCGWCNSMRACVGSMPLTSHDHTDVGAAPTSSLLHRLPNYG
jgi:hypothetical protein